MVVDSAFLEACKAWDVRATSRSPFGFKKISISPGSSVTVRCLDSVFITRLMHYIDKRGVICPEEGCSLCSRGDRLATRHFINVLDKEANEVKVLEFSPAVRVSIKEVVEWLSTQTEIKLPSLDIRNYDLKITKMKVTEGNPWVVKYAGNDTVNTDVYTLYDLEKLLIPVTAAETYTIQEAAPVGASRPISDFSEPPKPVIPSIKEVENPLAKESIL